MDIGKSHGHDVKSQESSGPQDPDSCTGQTSETHVLTVCVGDDMVSTEGEHKGKYTEEGSPNHPKTNKRYYLIGKEPAIMKWVTNSYIMVISHGKKHY